MPGKQYSGGISRGWKAIRLFILLRDRYLCVPCLKRGVRTLAREVDHITVRADLVGEHDPDNLQAICVECHEIKSAIEARLAFRRWVRLGRPTVSSGGR